MDNQVLLKYHPEFKNIAGRSIMEYVFDEKETLPLQLEMLGNNKIPGLLKCEYIRLDGNVRLNYSITSLIPLKKYLERNKLKRADFLHIIKQLASLLDMLEEYFLDIGGIVFDNQLIFIDPQGLTLEFTYLPVIGISSDMEPLKEYLMKTLIHDIHFANENSDNYVQKLIELLKSNAFNVSLLTHYVRDMGKSESTGRIPGNSIIVESSTSIVENIESPKNQAVKPVKAPETEIIRVKKTCYPLKSHVIMYSIIGAFIIFGIILGLTGTLSIKNSDFLLTLFGYLMIGGAISYLGYSKLFTKDNKVERVIEKKVVKDNIQGFQDLNYNNNLRPLQQTYPSKPQNKPMGRMEYVNKAIGTPAKSIMKGMEEASYVKADHDESQFLDRTVILDGGSIKSPSLKGMGMGSETIILNRFPFLLGRLEGKVDYCLKNPAIGKFHAEIKKNEDGYYISDINSRNGTLVNNQRLEPNREYKLNNGDHIVLANEEFIFMS